MLKGRAAVGGQSYPIIAVRKSCRTLDRTGKTAESGVEDLGWFQQMFRYHESGTICQATQRACPLGLANDEHIEAYDREDFELKLSERFESVPSVESRRSAFDPKEIIANYESYIQGGMVHRRAVDWVAIPVSAREKAAIEHYAAGYGFNHESYPTELVGSDPLDDPEVLSYGARTLDGVFDRVEQSGPPVTSYRAMGLDGERPELEADFLRQLKSGEVSFPGYTSTTPDMDEALNYSYGSAREVMLTLEGRGGLAFDHRDTEELLYRRNTRWKVSDYREDSEGNITATLRQLGPSLGDRLRGVFGNR